MHIYSLQNQCNSLIPFQFMKQLIFLDVKKRHLQCFPSFNDTESYSDNSLDFRPKLNANQIHFAAELQNKMKTVDFEMTTLEDYI